MKTIRQVLILTCLVFSFAGEVICAADTTAITLPVPRLDGSISVEQALHDRRSLRSPAVTPLTLAEVGQLCWAAQGVTDAKGHRTAPSAMALYPLELYVLAGTVTDLAPGFYHYDPATHSLQLVATGDKRAEFNEQAVGQDWISGAPAIFVITGSVGKLTRMKDRGRPYMYVEAGLAAQGFFLQATALGLGSTYVGGFSPQEARLALGLPESEEVIGVLPVGHRP